MNRGEIRYCACGCGHPAKRMVYNGRFKAWRLYSTGHAPNEKLAIRVPSTSADLAYAAGIIDGEGCVYTRVQSRGSCTSTFIQLQVTMCSEKVIQWLDATFGGQVCVQQPPSLKHRTRFTWQIRGRHVIPVLKALLPYLKEKSIRARLAIQLAEMIQSGTKRLTEEQVSTRKAISLAIKGYNRSGRGEDFIQ